MQYIYWLQAHWQLITTYILLIIIMLNPLTKHFSQHNPGLAHKLTRVTEFLSFLASDGVKGWIWKLKPPFVSVPPPTYGRRAEDRKEKESTDRKTTANLAPKGEGIAENESKTPKPPLVLFLFLFLFIIQGYACASWQDNTDKALVSISLAAQGVSSIIENPMHEACMVIAKECGKKKDTACLPLIKCQEDKGKVNMIIIGIHQTVSLGRVAIQLNDKSLTMKFLKSASERLKQTKDSLTNIFKLYKIAPDITQLLGENK